MNSDFDEDDGFDGDPSYFEPVSMGDVRRADDGRSTTIVWRGLAGRLVRAGYGKVSPDEGHAIAMRIMHGIYKSLTYLGRVKDIYGRGFDQLFDHRNHMWPMLMDRIQKLQDPSSPIWSLDNYAPFRLMLEDLPDAHLTAIKTGEVGVSRAWDFLDAQQLEVATEFANAATWSSEYDESYSYIDFGLAVLLLGACVKHQAMAELARTAVGELRPYVIARISSVMASHVLDKRIKDRRSEAASAYDHLEQLDHVLVADRMIEGMSRAQPGVVTDEMADHLRGILMKDHLSRVSSAEPIRSDIPTISFINVGGQLRAAVGMPVVPTPPPRPPPPVFVDEPPTPDDLDYLDDDSYGEEE